MPQKDLARRAVPYCRRPERSRRRSERAKFHWLESRNKVTYPQISPGPSSLRPGPVNPCPPTNPWLASAGSQTHRQSSHLRSLLLRSQSPAGPFHSRLWHCPSFASALSFASPLSSQGAQVASGSSAYSPRRQRSRSCCSKPGDFPRPSEPVQWCCPMPILRPTQRTKPRAQTRRLAQRLSPRDMWTRCHSRRYSGHHTQLQQLHASASFLDLPDCATCYHSLGSRVAVKSITRTI